VENRVRRVYVQRIDAALAFVVLVWGFSPTLFKVALAELQPLTFVFVRFVLLSLVAIAVLAWRGARGGRAWQIARGDVPLLVVSGLSGYGFYQLCYMIGLAHTTIFASALLVATVPLWSAVILAVRRIEPIAGFQWAGILLSLAGVAWFLLAARSSQTELAVHRTLSVGDILVGNALSLCAAFLFALYGVTNKRLGQRYSPPELMCYTLIIGTLALAPVGIPALLSQNWSTVTWRTWLIIPYSVAFPIYITYTIWNWAIAQRGVGYVTLYSYLVPVLGGIFGFLLLGEALAPLQLVAGALVLGGMLVARHAATRAGKQTKPDALPAARLESPHPVDAPKPVELFE
jgi:drug/metabolite transporter (DMT)-like permease